MPCPPPGDLPNSGIEPRSPTLLAYCLPSEPPVKPKNTGVGILSLLQGILQNQDLIRALLNRRQIFCQLSYQGSPFVSPVQFCILNSSHIFSSIFTICNRLYLLCFFLCYFIFFVYAYLWVCFFCLVFWKAWVASYCTKIFDTLVL